MLEPKRYPEKQILSNFANGNQTNLPSTPLKKKFQNRILVRQASPLWLLLIPTWSKQKKKLLCFLSFLALGVSSESSRTPIKELVPGDSGAKMEFSEAKIRGGIAVGSGGHIPEIKFRSTWIISLKLGRAFGSSLMLE